MTTKTMFALVAGGVILLLMVALLPGAVIAQSPEGTPDPVGTLPVPTPVPVTAFVEPTPRPTESALARIVADGVLRVGVLYNAPPLSRLNERGEVVGYEAGIARAIAEAWGVEVAFTQVTRQTRLDMLLSGAVDVLMASVVHGREDEALLGFSHTVFPGGQMLLVPEAAAAQTPADLNGQAVGVVQGTESERALSRALNSGAVNVTPRLYLTLDQAVGALGSGEVAAVLGGRVDLLRVRAEVSGVRLLAEPLEPAPVAIAYRRYDAALGYLLDRTLQRLYAEEQLVALWRTWLPGVTFDLTLPLWDGLDDDTRTLADFDTALQYPAESALDRLRGTGVLRVAGIDVNAPPGDGLDQRMAAFYRALLDDMARRWGVTVTYLTAAPEDAVNMVAAGEADVAVGFAPRWDGPYAVAYSLPVTMHGDRLLIPANSDIAGFDDLRGGRWVGIFASEPGAADRVNALAEAANTAVNIFTIVNDEDAVYSMTVEQNIDVVYGDSLRLLPLVAANPDLVTLTERWYSRAYDALAVSRFDPDFLALVNVTLQAMAADGTFARLWAETTAAGEPIPVEVWPGDADVFLGFPLR